MCKGSFMPPLCKERYLLSRLLGKDELMLVKMSKVDGSKIQVYVGMAERGLVVRG